MITPTYDLDGRRTKLDHPLGAITYAYDKLVTSAFTDYGSGQGRIRRASSTLSSKMVTLSSSIVASRRQTQSQLTRDIFSS